MGGIGGFAEGKPAQAPHYKWPVGAWFDRPAMSNAEGLAMTGRPERIGPRDWQQGENPTLPPLPIGYTMCAAMGVVRGS
jgi:hypothetical protein